MLVTIKRGDTRPLDVTLTANRVPLTGGIGTVRFLMQPRKIGQGSVVDADAEVLDEAKGLVRYAWKPEDVDAPGIHRAEFEVTFDDGTVETFPNGEWLDVEILSDLEAGSLVEPGPSPGPSPPSSVALDDLTDVVIAVPQIGDRLVWDGTQWVNKPRVLNRFYGPDTSTPLAADQWTLIPLTGEIIKWGDIGLTVLTEGPYIGCLECTETGIYSLAAAVVFDTAQGTGERGVWITDMRLDTWNLLTGATMNNKANVLPLMVSGDVHLYAGDVIGLQAYSTVNTATTPNPHSEWLSAST